MGVVHVTGMKEGSEGMQMVEHTYINDPVLLNFLEHAGLKPDGLGKAGLKKAKEMAQNHGLYKLYEQNASEDKKQRDQQRLRLMEEATKVKRIEESVRKAEEGTQPWKPPKPCKGKTVCVSVNGVTQQTSEGEILKTSVVVGPIPPLRPS